MTTEAERLSAARLNAGFGRPAAPGRLRRLTAWVTPPIHDPRFWATQGLVAFIAATHDSIELLGWLPNLHMAYFLPISLFFIPVVYAALYFGLAGSLPTALWCNVLSSPNFLLWHTGSERLGVMLQMFIVDCIAVFVGGRVDAQMRARHQAEAASKALRVSEGKYRGLFEAAGDGVLVLDEGGQIVECNTVGCALLGTGQDSLVGHRFEEVLEPELAAVVRGAILAQPATIAAVPLPGPAGETTWVEPLCTTVAEAGGLIQVVFRDVTEQRRRQAGLETFSAQIMQAQEDERKRIAQELHDDTLQSLLVLCRLLDDSVLTGLESELLLAKLRESHDFAASVADSVRGFARGLRPALLDDLGLDPALDRLVTELTSRSSISGRLVVRGMDGRLPPDVELALFRIGQEALSNVERHSKASRVRVTLDYGVDRTRLIVADDGLGFVPPRNLNDLASESRLGLLGMHERTRVMGGKLRIRSAPGSGTRLTAEIPRS